jgi:uncharacterized membrane protein YtjA (UPF0391 family)
LKWALIFLVISIIAGLLGFTGISAGAADIGRFLFYIFVMIFLALVVLGLNLQGCSEAPASLYGLLQPSKQSPTAKPRAKSPKARPSPTAPDAECPVESSTPGAPPDDPSQATSSILTLSG